MESVDDRQRKMERYCSTGQSPQWDVAPREEEATSLLHSTNIVNATTAMATSTTTTTTAKLCVESYTHFDGA